MEMDDKDFYVVRKNLNILSVLILLLAYTNAKLGTFNFLGIQIELNGPKLYTGIFIGYAYFIWRFLTKLPLRGHFWAEFINYYLTSDEGVKRKYNYKNLEAEVLAKWPDLAWLKENDKDLRLQETHVMRFEEKSLTKLTLSLTFYKTLKLDSETYANSNVTTRIEIKVPRLFIVRTLVLFCVKYDKFGDYLFPLIPGIVNLVFFFSKPEWQGSFRSLFMI